MQRRVCGMAPVHHERTTVPDRDYMLDQPIRLILNNTNFPIPPRELSNKGSDKSLNHTKNPESKPDSAEDGTPRAD